MSKRIIPQQSTVVRVKAQKVSSAKKPLEDALTIMDQQIERMLIKSGQDQTLTTEESKTLQGYVKSLVEIRRDEREEEKFRGEPDELDKMSDAELIEYAKKQLEAKNSP